MHPPDAFELEPGPSSVPPSVEVVSDRTSEWDAYVEGHAEATLSHAAAWSEILERAYGMRPLYLLAREEGAGPVVGVLPFAELRTLTGHKELVSLPFLDFGGVLSSNETATRQLVRAAQTHARRIGARAIELRHAKPVRGVPSPQDPFRVDLRLPLSRDEEQQWQAIGAKTRNQVRKAQREGVEIVAGSTTELLREFYKPYATNMRDLGSPAHDRSFFAEAAAAFGPRLRCIVAQREGASIAGLVAIHFADRVTVPWASSLRSANKHCPNNLIYWEALRWAISRGARTFDFGRSPLHSGTHQFKRGWGAQEHPLSWTRLTPSGDSLPLVELSENLWLRKMSRAWTRLPVPLTTWIGGRVRPYLSS